MVVLSSFDRSTIIFFYVNFEFNSNFEYLMPNSLYIFRIYTKLFFTM